MMCTAYRFVREWSETVREPFIHTCYTLHRTTRYTVFTLYSVQYTNCATVVIVCDIMVYYCFLEKEKLQRIYTYYR